MEKYARAVIVLVHGTWGRGLWPSARRSKQTRWFDPRSEFSRRLATGLGRESPALEVIPFCWSGANSLVQRHKAANDLAFLIEKKFGSLLSTKVIIVGHSHGGNVALMASHILRDRADVGMVAIDVVALATPFVRMFPAQQTGGLQPFLAVVFSFYLTLFFEPIARIQRYLSAFLGFYNALLISVIVVSTVILLACVPFIGWNESTLPTLHRRVSRKRDHLISHCPAMSIGQDIGLLGSIMPCELDLRFDGPDYLVVSLYEAGGVQVAKPHEFLPPFDAEPQRDLQWYFEIYPVQYTTELDEDRASRIDKLIPAWGAALFGAAFSDREAERLFYLFQDAPEEGKLVTISSDHPTVLAQPWELQLARCSAIFTES